MRNKGLKIFLIMLMPVSYTHLQLESRLEDGKIHTDILGSDHCPVELDLKI